MQFQIRKDRKGEWRWRLVAPNGRILADSGEGYKRRATMIQTIHKVRNGLVYAGIYEKGQRVV